MKLRAYIDLTKPGIVLSNALTAAAAFLYGSHHLIRWPVLLAVLLGLMCVIASACVFNNYFDRHIDARMLRTRGRALVKGSIAPHHALLFGALLLALGAKILLIGTTLTAFWVALAGFIIYVALYTPLKPRHPVALFVGALAGATPPVVGYAAAGHVIDTTAWLMFAFLFVWQLPHFIAIAIYRNEEYVAAGIPLFVHGPFSARAKRLARQTFYLTLVILLAWCALLVLA